MFPQLFGKLFATPPPPQQKYVMTWYDTEFFFYFKFSIAVPTFLINFITL